MDGWMNTPTTKWIEQTGTQQLQLHIFTATFIRQINKTGVYNIIDIWQYVKITFVFSYYYIIPTRQDLHARHHRNDNKLVDRCKRSNKDIEFNITNVWNTSMRTFQEVHTKITEQCVTKNEWTQSDVGIDVFKVDTKCNWIDIGL